MHSRVPCGRDLGFEVEVDELPLLSLPIPISVAIEHQLPGAGVPHLGRRVRQGPLGAPLQLVARGLGDEERLRAPRVAVAVEALLHGEVEDVAFGDGVGLSETSSEC